MDDAHLTGCDGCKGAGVSSMKVWKLEEEVVDLPVECVPTGKASATR